MLMGELFGKANGEYHLLEVYCDELENSNPGSYFRLEINKDTLREGMREFKCVFICLKMSKTNWKVHYKPILRLDGCFMKK